MMSNKIIERIPEILENACICEMDDLHFQFKEHFYWLDILKNNRGDTEPLWTLVAVCAFILGREQGLHEAKHTLEQLN